MRTLNTRNFAVNRTVIFVVIVNLIALFYGLQSNFGVAYILTAFLIESFLVGVGAIVTLFRHWSLNNKPTGVFLGLFMFSLAYFSWVIIMFVLPALMMEVNLGIFINDPIFSQPVNTISDAVLHVGAFLTGFLSELLVYLKMYHLAIIIALVTIYFVEYIVERPSDVELLELSFTDVMWRAFLRLMFIVFVLFQIGFLLYITFNPGEAKALPAVVDLIGVIIIGIIKFCRDINSAYKHSYGYGILNFSNRNKLLASHAHKQKQTALRDTFTY